jgi:hypothetical protein
MMTSGVGALVHENVADLGHPHRRRRPRRTEAGTNLLAAVVSLGLTGREQRKLVHRVGRMQVRQVVRGQRDHRAMERREEITRRGLVGNVGHGHNLRS